jgi:hypothetical protein
LVRRPLTGLLYQFRKIGDECGVVGGMKIGRGNRSTRVKPAPVLFRPPQIPHHLTLAGTRAAAVGSVRIANSAGKGVTLSQGRINWETHRQAQYDKPQ